MDALVIYDSQYGNTEKIARTIAVALESKILNIKEVTESSFKNISLLIVGSPTQGGRATKALSDFLRKLPSLEGINVTAFDTRLAKEKHGFGLKMLMNIIGFAAEKIANTLQGKEGNLIIHPKGFIVEDTKGPLAEKEIEKAKDWANQIKQSMIS